MLSATRKLFFHLNNWTISQQTKSFSRSCISFCKMASQQFVGHWKTIECHNLQNYLDKVGAGPEESEEAKILEITGDDAVIYEISSPAAETINIKYHFKGDCVYDLTMVENKEQDVEVIGGMKIKSKLYFENGTLVIHDWGPYDSYTTANVDGEILTVQLKCADVVHTRKYKKM